MLKQIIILRTDLKMRRGKEIAQGAHASMAAVLDNMEDPFVKEWLAGKFTKIAVGIESEDALLDIYRKALAKGVVASLIQDSGLTEFGGVPTYTAVAIGPGDPEHIATLTGHLKLR